MRDDTRRESEARRLLVRFAVLFIVYVLAFSTVAYVEDSILGAPVSGGWNALAARAVSWPLALMIDGVEQEGRFLGVGPHALEVVSDCTGIELFGIFTAAVLAFPAGAVQRLRGIALGLPILMALNFVRIVTLAYVKTFSETAFSWGHLYVWPVIVLTAGLGIWLYWMKAATGREAPAV